MAEKGKQPMVPWDYIFNAIYHPTFILDTDFNILAANDAQIKILGMSQKDIIGQKCYAVAHGTYRPPDNCPLVKLKTSKDLVPTTGEMNAFGGIYFITCYPIVGKNGDLDKVIHVATEITRLKDIENKLNISEEKYRALYEYGGYAIFTYDRNLKLIDLNQLACEYLGKKKEDLLGKNIFSLGILHPDDMEIALNGIEKLLKGSMYVTSTLRFKLKDGSYGIFEVMAYVIKKNGEIVAINNICQDVTEKMQLFNNLKESEEKFRTLTERSLVGIYIIQDNVFKYVNPTLAKIFGYKPSELVNKKGLLDLTHPEDRALVKNNIRKRLNGKAKSMVYEFRGLRKDGTVIDVVVYGTVIEYQGQPAIIGTLVDITKKKKAEWELKRSIANLKTLNRIIHTVSVAGPKDIRNKLSTALRMLRKVIPFDSAIVIARINGEGKVMARCNMSNDVLREIMHLIKKMGLYTKPCRHLPNNLETEISKTLKRVTTIIPMIWEDEIIGIMCLFSKSKFTKTERSWPLIETVADHFATAIGRYNLFCKNKKSIAKEQYLRSMLEDVFGGMRAFVVSFDRSGKITYMNPYALEYLDLEIEDVMGKKIESVIKPEIHVFNITWIMTKIIASNRLSVSTLIPITPREGDRRYMEWEFFLLRGERDEILGATAIGRDIGEIRKNEVARKIMDSTGIAISPFLRHHGSGVVGPIVMELAEIFVEDFERETQMDAKTFARVFSDILNTLSGRFTYESVDNKIYIRGDICIWTSETAQKTPFFCSLCRGLLYTLHDRFIPGHQVYVEKTIGNRDDVCEFVIEI